MKAVETERVDGGFRLHINADGQQPSPGYEIVE
jgi:hypothetical protein